MSYEGYEQLICENGHYWEEDALQMFEEYGVCRICQGKVAWSNSVDQTNGPSQGEILYEVLKEKFLLTPEVVEVCNLGHPHQKSPDIFRVPTRDETKPLRVYVDEDEEIRAAEDEFWRQEQAEMKKNREEESEIQDHEILEEN